MVISPVDQRCNALGLKDKSHVSVHGKLRTHQPTVSANSNVCYTEQVQLF